MIHKLFLMIIFTLLFSSLAFSQSGISQEELILQARGETPEWKTGVSYQVNDYVKYEDTIYRVIQEHTSQVSWKPVVSPSLFVQTTFSRLGEISDFIEPTGSHDSYNIGDTIIYDGYIYQSTINGNVWLPTTQYWTEIGVSSKRDIVTFENSYFYNEFASISNLQGNESVILQPGLVSVTNYTQTNQTYTVMMYTGSDNITYDIIRYENFTDDKDHVLRYGDKITQVTSQDGFITFQTTHFSTLVNSIPDIEEENDIFDIGYGLGFFFDNFNRVMVTVRTGSHSGTVVGDMQVGDGSMTSFDSITNLDVDFALQYNGQDAATLTLFPQGITVTYYVEVRVASGPFPGDEAVDFFKAEFTNPPGNPPTQTVSIPNIILDINDDTSFSLSNFFSNADYYEIQYTDSVLSSTVSFNNELGFAESSSNGEIYTSLNVFNQLYIESFEHEFTDKVITIYADNQYGFETATFLLTVEDATPSTPPPSTDLDLFEGLVSYYKLDEITATSVIDQHGANDGTASNSRIFTSNTGTSGKINSGADFTQGNDDIITFIQNTQSSFTWSFWYKRNGNPSSNEVPIANYESSGATDGVGVRVQTNGDIFLMSGAGVNTRILGTIPNPGINDNNYHQMILAFDGDRITFYIDGVLKSNVSQQPYPSSAVIRLGQRGSSSSPEWFNGFIDEVGIWDRAITTQEVEELYNNGNALAYESFFEEIPIIIPTQIASISPIDLEYNQQITLNLNTFFENVESYTITYFDPDVNDDVSVTTSLTQDTDYAEVSFELISFLTIKSNQWELQDNEFVVEACSMTDCITDTFLVSITEPEADVPTQIASISPINLGLNQEVTVNMNTFFENYDTFSVSYYDPDLDDTVSVTNILSQNTDYTEIQINLNRFLTIKSKNLEYLGNEFSIEVCNNDGCITDTFMVNIVDLIIQKIDDIVIEYPNIEILDLTQYFQNYESLFVTLVDVDEVITNEESFNTGIYGVSLTDDILTLDTSIEQLQDDYTFEVSVSVFLPSSTTSITENFFVTIQYPQTVLIPPSTPSIEDGYIQFLTGTFAGFFPDANELSFAQKMILVIVMIVFIIGMIIYIGTTYQANMNLLVIISSLVIFFMIIFFTAIGYIPISIIILMIIFTIIGLGVFIRNKLFGQSSQME